MAVKSNSQPAPQRQVVLTFATPSVADILFYETVDGQRIGTAVPDYGTPHPDSRKWPNHKLVFIQNDDETGQMLRYYYAADRDAQEEHNWKVSYPYAGLTTCPRFSCEFIESKEVFNPIAKGTAHPLDLGANTPEQNLRFVGAKLIYEEEVELPEELRSIYHAVQRVYDKVPNIAEQEAFNFEVEYPYLANTAYPRTTRRYVVPRADLSSAVIPSAGLNLNGSTLAARKVDRFEGQPEDSLYVLVTTIHDKVPTIAEQEAFNFEIEYPYLANTAYPRTTRRYVVPRADLSSAVIPSAGLNLNGATLAARKVDRFEGQLEDSLHVLVTTVHDKIPLLSDTSAGGGLAFLRGFGYSITRPYGTDDHFRLTWRVPGVKAGYTPTVDYTSCPVTGYTSLVLVNEVIEAQNENAGTVDLLRVYDSLPGPALEKRSKEKLASIPEAFIATRDIETIRQPVRNNATIASLSGLPTDYSGGILETGLGVNGENKLVFDKGQVRVTVTTGPTVDQEYDPLTGELIMVTQQLVPAGTAGEPIDSTTGEYATIKQINQFYAIKTTRKPTMLGTGSNARSYENIINWAWPPVLLAIEFFGVSNKDGSIAKVGYNVEFKEGYSGPCRAVITESWSPVAIAAPVIVPMIPTPLECEFPLTSLNIPACLHQEVTFTEVIGTNHPTLAYTAATRTFGATNYTDWPNTIVGQFTQTPYQGGFRIESVLIYKPDAERD